MCHDPVTRPCRDALAPTDSWPQKPRLSKTLATAGGMDSPRSVSRAASRARPVLPGSDPRLGCSSSAHSLLLQSCVSFWVTHTPPWDLFPAPRFPVSVIVVPSHSPTQTWVLPPGCLEFNAPGSPEATPPFQRSQLPSAETRSASRPRRPRHLHHDLCVTGERSAQLRQREGTGRAGRVQLGFGKGKALPR